MSRMEKLYLTICKTCIDHIVQTRARPTFSIKKLRNIKIQKINYFNAYFRKNWLCKNGCMVEIKSLNHTAPQKMESWFPYSFG